MALIAPGLFSSLFPPHTVTAPRSVVVTNSSLNTGTTTYNTVSGINTVSIPLPDTDNKHLNYAELNGGKVIFMSEGKILFTIMEDGRISKGEAFTTTDEMSLEFWKKVVDNFPVAWWRSLIKSQSQKAE